MHKEKDAEKVSSKLAKKNDTLSVIGHLSTTASANALPNYLNADLPIPVILALETNPELLPADYHLNYYPVFRLSPTDDQQAEKAAEFAIEHGARAIWVVEDVVLNPIYSRYLAQEFVRQIHERSNSAWLSLRYSTKDREAGSFFQRPVVTTISMDIDRKTPSGLMFSTMNGSGKQGFYAEHGAPSAFAALEVTSDYVR